MTAGGAAQAANFPRLARPAPGRGLWIQPQVGQDLLDHRPLEDGRDDLQFPGAAVRAVLHVDVKDALAQPRPADSVRSALNRPGLAFAGSGGFGGLLLHLGLSAPHAKFVTLATHAQDPAEALRMVCEELGAMRIQTVTCTRLAPTAAYEEGPLTPASIGSLLATLIPEQAIVVNEAISTGRAFDVATRDAAPHEWLTNMGGSIGFGLPVAVGAAIAAPDRRVIALEGDDSAMYTLQSLWTMARESLDVTVVVFANRSYKILRGEYAQVGAGAPRQRAADMLSIDRPTLDWTALASGQGVPACRVTTLGQFSDAMRRSIASEGSSFIEVVM